MVAACVALALAAVTVATPLAVADDKLKKKQRQAHSQVRSAMGDLDESSKELVAAAKRLSSARSALASAQRRLAVAQKAADAAARVDAQMQAKLQTAEHQLAVAREALDTARQRVVDQRAAIGRLAASNYANGDPALMGLSVMLTSQDPAEVTTQMNTVTSLMSRQTTLLDSLRTARAQLAAQETKVEQMRAAVAVQRKAAAENLVRKEGLEQSAAQARASVATLVVRARAAEAAATRAHRADQRQLRAAKQQENRIRQLIIERSRRQHGGYSGNTGGFLYRPVPGYVTSPYGWREHPIYHYWGLHDGTDFHAPCGTPLRAAGSGHVISEVWSDVYGHRLYLDLGRVNGKNMTVVYNHASSYRVGTGAHVRRGETLGSAGTTGWSTGCHLHFTVLLDGNPVDPMHYM
ncbi:M23 family metallopeptidase [Marmoricola sp. URHB0036]|uniref:peptidoglycan DD-metalloendopeptidase family protein n=1 Tax=Marmoricola sp. URHB0036 TaxID=1298863 RepID=UPI00041A0A6A|nr:M23 family metallopeptidase [Marmoricola sp. URHB0036]